MKRTAATLTLALVVLVLLAGVLLYAGIFPVAADQPHWAVTARVMEIARDRAIDTRSDSIIVPPLQEARLVSKGAGEYAEMCVACHRAPGMPEDDIRLGLNPKPPSLLEHRMDPRRAFWVIKHGLKMTAMPAWGSSHDDETIWAIVAFIDKLPGMTPAQYASMTRMASDGEMPMTAHHSGGASAASEKKEGVPPSAQPASR